MAQTPKQQGSEDDIYDLVKQWCDFMMSLEPILAQNLKND